MKTILKIAAAIAFAALLLPGCKDASTPTEAAKPAAKTPITTAAIESGAHGFVVGSPMAVRTVYVFFDPQCPHCAVLWQSARALKAQAKFVWIPVGLIGPKSVSQAATILAAKDPIAAMDENEASVLEKRGGIAASGDSDAQKAVVEKNTALFTGFGFESVPSIVALHAQTGALVTHEGSLPTADLATLLGLQVPAAQ